MTDAERIEVYKDKEVIAEFMALMECGILVRNTARDNDYTQFLQDGIRLTQIIAKAQEQLDDKNVP